MGKKHTQLNFRFLDDYICLFSPKWKRFSLCKKTRKWTEKAFASSPYVFLELTYEPTERIYLFDNANVRLAPEIFMSNSIKEEKLF
jgi:hypothetical protein